MSVATALSEFAGSLRYEDVPSPVVHRAKLLLLDAIGVAFASSRYEFARKGLAGVRRLGSGESIVIGSNCTLSPRDAALMNGMLIHGLDYDDTYLPGSVHLCSSTIACALAAAFDTSANGRELLMACVLGLEVGARIAASGKGAFQQAGFHPTGTCGALSSALVAGRLYGLDTRQRCAALGISLSLASGSMQPVQDGSWTKRVHPGWAAGAGITAAALAAEGFVGSEAVFEGHFGFYKMFMGSEAGSAEPAMITRALGQDWEFIRTSIKLFPACNHSHAFINAAIGISVEHDLRIEDIESVDARVAQASVPLVCEPLRAKQRPDSSYLAQFSLPYAIACGLARRRFGLDEIESSSFTDPDLVRLAQRVQYEVDPNSGYPNIRSGEIIVRMRDGREFRRREIIRPDEPALESAIIAKYMSNVAGIIGQPRADELCALILNIERETDSRRASRYLRHDGLGSSGGGDVPNHDAGSASRAETVACALTQPSLPLVGVRVIDFTHHAAGPMCTMLLGDYGAEVIKIEPPEGEAFRTSGTVRINGEHVGFLALNRNKKSIVIDLKTTTGRQAVLELIRTAHVVVENFRPGTMERLGLGYEILQSVNPGIVYCSLSAFGATGPDRNKQGLDIIIQAMSGLMSLTGEPDGGPMSSAAPIADISSGVFGTLGIVLAVLEQRRSGRPQRVEISMLDCMASMLNLRFPQMFAEGKDLPRLGTGHPQAYPYGVFHAADRSFVIAATRDEYWVRLCEAIGAPHLAHDPAFSTIKSRVANRQKADELLHDIFRSAPRDHWLRLLDAANVPNGPVNSLTEVVASPQMQHSGTFSAMPHPRGGQIPTVLPPIRINGRRLEHAAPPDLGADTEAVLAALSDRLRPQVADGLGAEPMAASRS